jgi:hypothetical protein
MIGWMTVHGVYIAALVILYSMGIVYDTTITGSKLAIFSIEEGHSFGMGHPNALGLLILSTTLGVWYLWKPKKWPATLVLFEAAAAGTMLLTVSRTSVILLAVFPVIALIFSLMMKQGDEKRLKRAAAFNTMLPTIIVLVGHGL